MGRLKRVYAKRRFCGNQYKRLLNKPANENCLPCQQGESNLVTPIASTSGVTHQVVSASKRKLVMLEAENSNEKLLNIPESCGNIIVNLDLLSQLFNESVKCKYCDGSGCFSLVEEKSARKGLCCKISLNCKNCNFIQSTRTSSLCNGKYYEINLRLVYGMRCIGKGQKAADTLCGMLDLPPPPSKFSNYFTVITTAVDKVAENSMKSASEEAIAINEDSRDICVAFDGTWQRRGHKSLNGVVSATSFDSGKVLDIEVLSKYCLGCNKNTENHKCNRNYEGFSGGMESTGVLNIFHRSEATRGIRYSKYLGDGDSKAFMKVQEAKPYGDNLDIVKLECVGHIQKRLGSRLRKLKRDMKGQKLADGKALGGPGRLTDAEIDLLQTYFGLAIRRNSNNLKAMREAVWATFLHKCSTDEMPQHVLCPKGPDSWCKYQRSQVTGESYCHKHSLPYAVAEVIKPVYRDLSKPELLKRCLHGKTQNPNESLNNCIWERVPKSVFVSLLALNIGVKDAVITFNDGSLARVLVLREMGITPGKNCWACLQRIDKERIYYANKAAELGTKEGRTKRRQENCRKEVEDEEYNPGMF